MYDDVTFTLPPSFGRSARAIGWSDYDDPCEPFGWVDIVTDEPVRAISNVYVIVQVDQEEGS